MKSSRDVKSVPVPRFLLHHIVFVVFGVGETKTTLYFASGKLANFENRIRGATNAHLHVSRALPTIFFSKL